MTKKAFLFLCIFCTGLGSNSQNSLLQKGLSVALSPALLKAPGLEPGLQAGLQYQYRQWALVVESAFLFRRQTSNYINLHYHRAGAEVKHYFKKNRPEYLSLQSTYAYRQFTDSNRGKFFRRSTYDSYTYDRATITSPIFTTVVKMGAQLPVCKNIMMDVFGGLGWAVITTRYAAQNVQQEIRYGWFRNIGFYGAHRYDKTIQRLHLVAGFRLHYFFLFQK